MSYPAPIFTWNANSKQLHPLMAFSRASQATEIDGTGLIRTVNTGVPRFEHDPMTGVCKGLLIEPAVTFLDNYSEQFDNAAWSKPGATVTSNAAVAPDGTMTSDKLVENASLGNHVVSKVVSTNCTLSHSFVIYAKKAGRTRLRMLFDRDAAFSDYCYCNIDLDSGSVIGTYNIGTASGASAAVEALPGGVFKCTLSGVPSTTAGSTLRCIVYTDSGNWLAYHQGDGASGLYIWGAKIYAGVGPTSYLPTISAGVTRAADLCSVDLTKLARNGNPLWTGKEGTLVVSFRRDAIVPGLLYPGICSLNSDGWNRITMVINGDNQTIGCSARTTDGWQVGLTAGLFSKKEQTKVAYAFSVNNFATAMNGVLGQKSLTGLLPTVTTLYLGYEGMLNYLNGTIKSVKLYNRRIPDADLVALSSL